MLPLYCILFILCCIIIPAKRLLCQIRCQNLSIARMIGYDQLPKGVAMSFVPVIIANRVCLSISYDAMLCLSEYGGDVISSSLSVSFEKDRNIRKYFFTPARADIDGILEILDQLSKREEYPDDIQGIFLRDDPQYIFSNLYRYLYGQKCINNKFSDTDLSIMV